MKYPLITICGSYHLQKEWVIPCIESWKNIQNIDQTKLFIIPDQSLDETGISKFKSLHFNLFTAAQLQKIEDKLQQYPFLKKMREKELFWKKIVDIAIAFSEHEKVVYIDTDVFVNYSLALPEGDFDLAYMREDIPAYDAHWKIVWKEKMVPALQGGLVVFKPALIDLGYLEHIVKNYFINCKHTWWTEQAAWACIAGKTEKRLLFSGKQVRAVSGIKKRSYDEIVQNKYKYFGSSIVITEFNDFKTLIIGSSILHFAGLGKKWFKPSCEYLQSVERSNGKRVIATEIEPTMSLIDKMMISTRLFLREWR